MLACALVSGCTMGPDYVRPPVPEPMDYREGFPPGESVANMPWWEMFGDTVLTNLIGTCLENNRNLHAALARIDVGRAQLGIVRADLFPRIDYFADGGVSGNTAEDGTSWDAAASLSMSYQLDLWGRIRRSNEAALQELLATEEAYRGLTISLVAEVSSAYMLLLDLDNRISISRQTLDARRASLDVIRARFNAGMVSEVDVNQAEIQVAEAEVSIHAFSRLYAQTENVLSVLLGVPPKNIEIGLPLAEQIAASSVPAGLPSGLLARRPDVIETERRLHAQTARIGVAEALKFPQFNLVGDLGAQFDGGETGFFDLAGQLFGPLFNAGENQRRVDVEVARTKQLLSQYEQTILSAYREVNDALVAVNTYHAEYEARDRQLRAAENAAKLSWVRYEGGLTSYLEVLDLQRSLFSSQLSASETRQLELTSIVRLYAALGGGWVAAQDTMGVFKETITE